MEINKRVILSVLVGVVVLGCFYYFLLGPQIKAYGSVKEELAREKTRLARAQIEVLSLQSENKKLEKTRKEFNKVNKLFTTDMRNGIDVILLGLKSASKNVEITDLEPKKIKETKYTLEIPLKITVEGNYRDMLVFIKDMENECLNNLAITRGLKIEATSEPGIIKTAMDVIIYSAKTPQGRLSLEELARWLTGRYNIFRPASGIAPLPELAGQIKPPVTPGKESKEPSNSKGTQHESITGAVYEPFSYTEPESESVWTK